jgi:hypothetical protein
VRVYRRRFDDGSNVSTTRWVCALRTKGVYADLADALVFMVSPANGFGGCAC